MAAKGQQQKRTALPEAKETVRIDSATAVASIDIAAIAQHTEHNRNVNVKLRTQRCVLCVVRWHK
jgi:hypothetical protein